MSTEYNKLIGTRVKMLRISKNVAQTDLAKAIGVTQTHLSNIENGRAGLTMINLIRLHQELHCPISSFFVDIENSTERASGGNSVSLDELTEVINLLKKSRSLG